MRVMDHNLSDVRLLNTRASAVRRLDNSCALGFKNSTSLSPNTDVITVTRMATFILHLMEGYTPLKNNTLSNLPYSVSGNFSGWQ